MADIVPGSQETGCNSNTKVTIIKVLNVTFGDEYLLAMQ